MPRPEIPAFWQDIAMASGHGARYRALASGIERGIESGELAAGSKLPPQRDLAFDLGVTVGTVGRAYDLLTRQGLLRGEVGRGTFVCDRREDAAAGSIELDDPDGLPSALNLTVNAPIRTDAMDQIAQLYAEIAASRRGIELVSQYPPACGLREARVAAAEWLASLGVATTYGQIILTSGAQSGVAAALAGVGRAGDGVLLEALCFTRFISAARTLGMRPEGIAIDTDGLIPDALDAACRQGRGRILVVSPTMNNPTGAFMPEARRLEIAEICRLHDLWVIEDDVYGPLVDKSVPKMSALIPERTIYVTSLSKFAAPGLRIGVVATPGKMTECIAARHGDLAIAAPAVAGIGLAEAWKASMLPRAAERQRVAIARRQTIVRQLLPIEPLRSPTSAPHLWLDCAGRTDDVVLQLASGGIKVASGRCFAVDPRNPAEYIRVSLGPPSDAGLAHACRRIASALDRLDIEHLAI